MEKSLFLSKAQRQQKLNLPAGIYADYFLLANCLCLHFTVTLYVYRHLYRHYYSV